MKYMLTVLILPLLAQSLMLLPVPAAVPVPDAAQVLSPYTGDAMTTILIVMAVSVIALVLLGMLNAVNKKRKK